MRKARAIAIFHDNAFALAFASATNTSRLLADFMYGTPERVKMTYIFAIGLAVLGGMLSSAAQASQFCSI